MRLFVDNLTNLDFSYLHSHRGIVGETWLASIELIGELDEQGMVCDFGIVKKMMRQWLDTEIDHRLLLPEHAAELKNLDQEGTTKLKWKIHNGELAGHSYFVEAPNEAITCIAKKEITKESVASWCIEKLRPMFPESVKEIRLQFTTEHITGPYYHYSHGLKKHDGNCQRIAHGHRSKIEIWKNNKLDLKLMEAWSEKWKDIYIGSTEDLTQPKDKKLNDYPKENSSFAYKSAQGSFHLSLPTTQCYLINSDSTVELIAKHIAEEIKREDPQNHFTVKAYEGLSKGAIVEL